VFYKLNSQKYITDEVYSGYGADVTLRMNQYTSIYAGYSESENRLSSKQNNIQAGIRYNNVYFNTGVTLFSRSGSVIYSATDSILNINSPFYYASDAAGLSLDLNTFIFSRLQLEGKIDYYRHNNDDPSYLLPPFYAAGGIYYRDSLFTGNLDLKTGFSVNYYGRRNYNFTPEEFAVYRSNTAGPDVRLDFFLSGEIQASAIIFFTIENLLNTRYFIVPFYPMPSTSVRFGVNWELFN
jgi:hypothetical protein